MAVSKIQEKGRGRHISGVGQGGGADAEPFIANLATFLVNDHGSALMVSTSRPPHPSSDQSRHVKRLKLQGLNATNAVANGLSGWGRPLRYSLSSSSPWRNFSASPNISPASSSRSSPWAVPCRFR